MILNGHIPYWQIATTDSFFSIPALLKMKLICCNQSA